MKRLSGRDSTRPLGQAFTWKDRVLAGTRGARRSTGRQTLRASLYEQRNTSSRLSWRGGQERTALSCPYFQNRRNNAARQGPLLPGSRAFVLVRPLLDSDSVPRAAWSGRATASAVPGPITRANSLKAINGTRTSSNNSWWPASRAGSAVRIRRCLGERVPVHPADHQFLDHRSTTSSAKNSTLLIAIAPASVRPPAACRRRRLRPAG